MLKKTPGHEVRLMMEFFNITEDDLLEDVIKRIGKSHAESADKIIEAVTEEDLK